MTSRRTASLLAWSSSAAGVVTVFAGSILAVAGSGDSTLFFGLVLPLVVATAVVGGLVASRQPSNPIGWIFCGFSVFRGLSALAAGYAEIAPGDARHGLGQLSAWFFNWSYVSLFALVIFVLLLFPDGRLPGGRWRAAAWAGGIGSLLLAVGSAVSPGRLDDFQQVENPFAADSQATGALVLVGALLSLGAAVAAVASVFARHRRADAVGRQQIKWLAAASVFTVLSVVVGLVVALLGAAAAGYSLILVATLAIPLAVGVAILRYRLYDIDRLISRSVTYLLVTAALAAAYTLLVLAGQALFSSFAGGSGLAIAVSTLVVAALFLPLRSRVQQLVDRRFYRASYDARRTLDTFGARLRGPIDLERLRNDLEDVVRDTMQPAHVTLWTRDGAS